MSSVSKEFEMALIEIGLVRAAARGGSSCIQASKSLNCSTEGNPGDEKNYMNEGRKIERKVAAAKL
jgi:hypothetical protein